MELWQVSANPATFYHKFLQWAPPPHTHTHIRTHRLHCCTLFPWSPCKKQQHLAAAAAAPAPPCVSNTVIFAVFCARQGKFLSFFFIPLRLASASVRFHFANRFIGVTTSRVFCPSRDIEKSPAASICGLLSNRSSSLPSGGPPSRLAHFHS